MPRFESSTREWRCRASLSASKIVPTLFLPAACVLTASSRVLGRIIRPSVLERWLFGATWAVAADLSTCCPHSSPRNVGPANPSADVAGDVKCDRARQARPAGASAPTRPNATRVDPFASRFKTAGFRRPDAGSNPAWVTSNRSRHLVAKDAVLSIGNVGSNPIGTSEAQRDSRRAFAPCAAKPLPCIGPTDR